MQQRIIQRTASWIGFNPIPLFPNQVILTDADPAMALAVQRKLPQTQHLYCVWHTFKNVNTNCSGALGRVELGKVMSALKCAAFAPTEQVRSAIGYETPVAGSY